MQKKLDEIANLWDKTKDPYYKDLWYQEVRRWAYGKNPDNISFALRLYFYFGAGIKKHLL
jgi:hypothetical protein